MQTGRGGAKWSVPAVCALNKLPLTQMRFQLKQQSPICLPRHKVSGCKSMHLIYLEFSTVCCFLLDVWKKRLALYFCDISADWLLKKQQQTCTLHRVTSYSFFISRNILTKNCIVLVTIVNQPCFIRWYNNNFIITNRMYCVFCSK